MSTAAALHKEFFAKVNAQLNLKVALSASHTGPRGWTATTEWHDEVKGSKLTGLSSNVIASAETGETYCQLNGWLGPKYFLPHMLLQVGENKAGKFCVKADYVPRGPNAFGTDDQYLQTHYGQDVLAWYDNAVTVPGSVLLPPSKSFAARLLRSPVHLAVGDLSFDDAAEIAGKHVTRWLAWVEEGRESEARQRGALNGRDDKLRQFAFRAALFEAGEWFGSENAATVAGAMTGPVAEAYVGGGG